MWAERILPIGPARQLMAAGTPEAELHRLSSGWRALGRRTGRLVRHPARRNSRPGLTSSSLLPRERRVPCAAGGPVVAWPAAHGAVRAEDVTCDAWIPLWRVAEDDPMAVAVLALSGCVRMTHPNAANFCGVHINTGAMSSSSNRSIRCTGAVG